jgi:dTDP-4-dehydrorhamnose reductase
MRILLTGRNGQVGWELQRALLPLGEVVALDRGGMDLSSPDSIRTAIRGAKPEIIVNAAAYTMVDKAESERDLAMRINGVAPGIMAEEAKRNGALLVHYSTDYVFDGTKPGPYLEDDAPNPVSSYGRSKLAGEEAIRATRVPHLILRTSWVYAARGNNFVRTMLRLARERSELRIVDDQSGAPTWARFLAEATAQVLGANGGTARDNSGLYHLTSAGAVSWFGLAEAIFAEARRRLPGFKSPTLVPIPTSAYPLPARRPLNSRLDTAKLTAAFGVKPPGWQAMLEQCMKEMQSERQ